MLEAFFFGVWVEVISEVFQYNPDVMDDLAEQLARRDRYRRKLAWAKTPEQRMREMAEMQERAWAVLRSNPAGYAWFMRRNFKARAVRARNVDAE
jgi:hypothetical protein